jgi:pimeloyl-ACP methyl ester carboxylesterase
MAAIERFFPVNGYRLAAKEWHVDAAIPVIACHGWLDNAASFDYLAPLLTQCHIIALDMPGHGLSDHKSPQASYNIWDDLLDILAVADAMQWPQFHLLGHSRGAIISMLLASAMPERILSLMMLDAVLPQPVAVEDSVIQLGRFLHEQSAIGGKRLSTYENIEAALKVRCRAAMMTDVAARPIVERGLKKTAAGYQWRSDPRLTMASAFKLTAAHNQAFVDAIRVPNLLLMAASGLGANLEFVNLVKGFATINTQCLAGSHHFHMEQPVQVISQRLNQFLVDLGEKHSGEK